MMLILFLGNWFFEPGQNVVVAAEVIVIPLSCFLDRSRDVRQQEQGYIRPLRKLVRSRRKSRRFVMLSAVLSSGWRKYNA